ncbi:MAG: transglutaminase domain-containing protein [Spirochaetales bacterium]|nr:transglutaminase domain-containing protein [Spirochaetales bacterium]
MMKSFFKFLLFVIIPVFFITICPPVSASDNSTSDEQKEEESWMEVYMLGDKIGYMHSFREDTVFQGQKAYAYKNEMYMKINRFNVNMESYNVDIYYTDPAYKPLGFHFNREMTGMKNKTFTGIIAGDKLDLTITEGQATGTEVLSLPDNFMCEESMTEQLLSEGFKAGMKRNFSIYSDVDSDFISIDLEVLGNKGIEINGETKDAFEVKYTYKSSVPYTALSYLSEEGETLRMDMSGLGISLVRSDRETAESEFSGLRMLSTTVKSDKILLNSGAIRRLEINVVSREELDENFFINDAFQKAIPTDNGFHLIVESAGKSGKFTGTLPLPEKEKGDLLPYLESSDMIQSKDAGIIKLAGEIAPDEKNIAILSRKISRKVRQVLSPSYELGFASALEALEQGKGDCTEYAMLFAALARARGIPVKVCFGMVYTGWNGFMFHAWNEVFAGDWLPVDSALGQDEVDATHIAIFKGEETRVTETGYKILKILNSLQFEIVEVSYKKSLSSEGADENN